jgi:FdhD protein
VSDEDRPEGFERVAVLRGEGTASTRRVDCVAEETAAALEYNGIAHTVMLMTPADFEDFALGFSLTEGIIARPHEMIDFDLETTDQGVILKLTIAAERMFGLKEHRRSMAGRTGCGLCGAETLGQVFRHLDRVGACVSLTPTLLHRAYAELAVRQPLQAVTGATHAAAWLDRTGAIVCLREDVGRHNALDKLIGALSRAHTDLADGALLLTSRASSEMVQKAAAMGIGLVAAVSAPTALARRLADQLGVTLVGFLRDRTHVVYTHPHRLGLTFEDA